MNLFAVCKFDSFIPTILSDLVLVYQNADNITLLSSILG